MTSTSDTGLDMCALLGLHDNCRVTSYHLATAAKSIQSALSGWNLGEPAPRTLLEIENAQAALSKAVSGLKAEGA